MITEALMSVFTGVWLGILSLLPEGDAEAFEESVDWEAAHGLFEPVFHLDGWLPMTLMLTLTAVMIGFRMIFLTYSTGYHIWKALPFT